jgi:carboxypeptidase Taq
MSSSKTIPSYLKMQSRIKEMHQLGYVQSILSWDMQTYMPSGAIEQRSDALSLLQGIQHNKLTNPENGDLLTSLRQSQDLTPEQKREIELFTRDYEQEIKIPAEFVKKLSKQTSITQHIWKKAKKKSDFSLVKDDLTTLVDLVKQQAQYLDPDKYPWDVHCHRFEPNVTSKQITSFFRPMKEGVLNLIKRYDKAMQNCDVVPHVTLLDVPSEKEKMIELSQWQMKLIGLEEAKSRCDESAHPFTTGTLNDVRITTHYLSGQPRASISSVFHEAGHALYNLNLPQDKMWTYHGGAVSAGVHESQSRYIENIICKSHTFLEYFFPILKQYIPAYESINSYDYIRARNAIMPSKIRIYADEVTYNLHIILRFELERDLFDDKITVDELPQVWNQKMKDYLGQDIVNDAEGVLQDMHWYSGYFGYFPSYALGNLYNAQMLHLMQHDLPDYKEKFKTGDITPVLFWLKTKIHNLGNMHDPLDFIEQVTGEPLNPHYFTDYLDMKYTQIYDLG